MTPDFSQTAWNCPRAAGNGVVLPRASRNYSPEPLSIGHRDSEELQRSEKEGNWCKKHTDIIVRGTVTVGEAWRGATNAASRTYLQPSTVGWPTNQQPRLQNAASVPLEPLQVAKERQKRQ